MLMLVECCRQIKGASADVCSVKGVQKSLAIGEKGTLLSTGIKSTWSRLAPISGI